MVFVELKEKKMNWIIVLKYFLLAGSIAYGFRNIGAVINKQSISAAQMWLMAISIAGFIALCVEV